MEARSVSRFIRISPRKARIVADLIRGKSVDEAMQITKQSVADALGGIPEYKMVCSNLAPDAIRKASDRANCRFPRSAALSVTSTGSVSLDRARPAIAPARLAFFVE